MEKSLNFRKYYFIDGAIGFWKWIPEGIDNALEVCIEDAKIKLCIHKSYSETSHHEIKEESIDKGNHFIKTFFMYIDLPYPDIDDDSLYEMNPPAELQTKLADIIRTFSASFYGIVRNEKIGQFELPNSHEIEALRDEQLLNNVEIKNKNGEWTDFRLAVFYGEAPIPLPDTLLDKERWFKLKYLIEKKYRTDLSIVFFRNAQVHLKEHQFRIALIELCNAEK
jgi:hypothetical protein